MNMTTRHTLLVIHLSFLTAVILSMLPLPSWARLCNPEWVILVLLYWVIALPYRVSVGTAWVLGLIIDTIQNTLLGEHALGMVLIAYLAIRLHRQLRMFPVWQQSFCVFLLIFTYEWILVWIQGMIGIPPNTWFFWLSSITSALLWPWIFLSLRDVRRRYGIN